MIIKKIMILVCCVLLSLSAKAQQTFSLFPIYKVETCSTEEDVPWRRLCICGRYVESEAFERQSSPLGAYFLGKWCSSVEK